MAVVALAFQPSTQQSISFPQRLIPGGIATVPYIGNITNNYFNHSTSYFVRLAYAFQNTRANGDKLASSDLYLSYLTAIYNAFGTPNISLSDVTASCSSGNCTFDAYHTLGICALPTVNLTDRIISTPNAQGATCFNDMNNVPNCTHVLPNGASFDTELEEDLNITQVMTNYTYDAETGYFDYHTNSIAYPEPLTSPIINFTVFYISNETNQVEAMECALQFCGQTYNTSVARGRTLTTLTNTWDTISFAQDNSQIVIEGGPVTFDVSLITISRMIGLSGEAIQGLPTVQEQIGSNWQYSEVYEALA